MTLRQNDVTSSVTLFIESKLKLLLKMLGTYIVIFLYNGPHIYIGTLGK